MKAKLFNYLITLIIVGLAVWAAVSLYRRYVEQPWTRDGQVRANVVGIAPRVSGPIIHVAVRDNQQLRQDGSSVATGFVLPVSGSNSTALLPSVSQTIDWVRLPQRFPVRIKVLGNSQMPLLIGQTVSVAMIPEVEPADITKQLTLAQP
jgi:multidrug resistance efflux pump